MSDRAWYLRLERGDVGAAAVLVGDRARARLAVDVLDAAVVRNEDRGLTTVTGTWRSVPVTVCAFGMGAPIAAVCLHELAALGVTSFVRAGTILALDARHLGALIVSEAALVHEGTSATYGAAGDRSRADPELLAAARDLVPEPRRFGLTASADGYYTQMTDLLGVPSAAATLRERWHEEGVLGVDMETSALYSAAVALGVACVSVCLATVALPDLDRLDSERRAIAERTLLTDALDLAVVGSTGGR